MHLNTRKERFSLAYINAVAARSGVVVSEPPVDRSSIDGMLMADFGRSAQINFQAKASSRDVMREGHLHFPLPRKNYDDLAESRHCATHPHSRRVARATTSRAG